MYCLLKKLCSFFMRKIRGEIRLFLNFPRYFPLLDGIGEDRNEVFCIMIHQGKFVYPKYKENNYNVNQIENVLNAIYIYTMKKII